MMDQQEERERLLHAIDLAVAREWEEAKALVETMNSTVADRVFLLLSSLEEREASRARQLATIRHEIGNSLSIARANLEGIVDGLLSPTPQRLMGLIAALESASVMLDSLRRPFSEEAPKIISVQSFDACELVRGRVEALRGLAAAKNVTLTFDSHRDTDGTVVFRGDPAELGHILDEALSSGIRLTSPGRTIVVECVLHGTQLEFRIKNHHPRAELPEIKRLVSAIGGEAYVETVGDQKDTVLVIDIPVTTAVH